MIFPFYKRATAIGICNFVARLVTVCSSLAAELDRPIPAIMLISVTVLAFIDAWFLPSYTEEKEYDKKLAEILGKGDFDDDDEDVSQKDE